MFDQKSSEISYKHVRIDDAFWNAYQDLIAEVVLPYQYKIMNDEIEGQAKSHAIKNFRIAAGQEEGDYYGRVFQDSDLAKWLEASSYASSNGCDFSLTKELEDAIESVALAQEDDGYLNTYFTLTKADKKWTDLQNAHELYCAGHMIEAGAAHFEASGKKDLLEVAEKSADLICRRFGNGDTQVRGIPGHQEIELALLKLYEITGKSEYFETASYFIHERGTKPNYFVQEAQRRTWSLPDHELDPIGRDPENAFYSQNHKPVLEQEEAIGHAVRALYMYTAMAKLARLAEDEEMYSACRRLWDDIVKSKLYITGGLGNTAHAEAFTRAYELPNDLMYNETCASVAMVFFAREMLKIEADGEYADVMEKELFNGVLSGMALDGKHFFYVNPLELVPGVSGVLPEYEHVLPERPGWYDTACCPPNVARLLSSLGSYIYTQNKHALFVHTYISGEVCFGTQGRSVLRCTTNYPDDGHVRLHLAAEQGEECKFIALHIPGWCERFALTIDGESADNPEIKKGYLYIKIKNAAESEIILDLKMPVKRMYCNPKVRENQGLTALQRGPQIYCFEETDNGKNLAALRLPRNSEIKSVQTEDPVLGSYLRLDMQGLRLPEGETLYRDHPYEAEPCDLKAIPYRLWNNRGPGGMRVWINEAE